MLGYYLDLALRSLRRNVALTILMIVAIAFGVGSSMTTLTVLHVLSADPIPGKSDQLFYVQLDHRKAAGHLPTDPLPDQVTRRDAENLVRAAKADHQAMMTGGSVAVEPERADLEPFYVEARYTSADFFTMFRVPFVTGTGWTAADDGANARAVVVARALAEKLFGTTAVLGRSLRVNAVEMRIIGVIDTWRPTPHFYDLYSGEYAEAEQVYLPFSTAVELRLQHSGSTNCWGDAPDQLAIGAPCEWIQLWVELDSSDMVAAYHDYLVHYSEEQRRVGAFELPPNPRLSDVRTWLEVNEVVPSDVRLQSWIALGFLLVCLINTVGLLLTKFLRRSSEIGVRRALGTSKRSIFAQLLVESGIIGLVGGLAGLGLACLGLWAVRQQPAQYADLARLDMPMLAATFGLAVITSVLAGLLPAWRGCQITPAIQLKSH